jgi:hypothetical protein
MFNPSERTEDDMMQLGVIGVGISTCLLLNVEDVYVFLLLVRKGDICWEMVTES